MFVLTKLRNWCDADTPQEFDDVEDLLSEVRDLIGFNGMDENDEIQITFKN